MASGLSRWKGLRVLNLGGILTLFSVDWVDDLCLVSGSDSFRKGIGPSGLSKIADPLQNCVTSLTNLNLQGMLTNDMILFLC